MWHLLWKGRRRKLYINGHTQTPTRKHSRKWMSSSINKLQHRLSERIKIIHAHMRAIERNKRTNEQRMWILRTTLRTTSLISCVAKASWTKSQTFSYRNRTQMQKLHLKVIQNKKNRCAPMPKQLDMADECLRIASLCRHVHEILASHLSYHTIQGGNRWPSTDPISSRRQWCRCWWLPAFTDDWQLTVVVSLAHRLYIDTDAVCRHILVWTRKLCRSVSRNSSNSINWKVLSITLWYTPSHARILTLSLCSSPIRFHSKACSIT